LRPLVRADSKQKTAALSRDYRLLESSSGLITITGGKWTTYRKMAEDVINRAELVGRLVQQSCQTQTLQIHGWTHEHIIEDNLTTYGSDADAIKTLILKHPNLGQPLHLQLEFQKAEVIWQTRNEMARQVEDVLARRTRALFLCAKTSIECAPIVAQLMAQELGHGQNWIDNQIKTYQKLAEGYLLPL
jgi:glycerol-3-phosphate dehydrogenase